MRLKGEMLLLDKDPVIKMIIATRKEKRKKVSLWLERKEYKRVLLSKKYSKWSV